MFEASEDNCYNFLQTYKKYQLQLILYEVFYLSLRCAQTETMCLQKSAKAQFYWKEHRIRTRLISLQVIVGTLHPAMLVKCSL